MDPESKCSDNDIYRALDMAQLTELVQQQAAGLDTEVTEGGENFSVGQRQVGITQGGREGGTETGTALEGRLLIDSCSSSTLSMAIRELENLRHKSIAVSNVSTATLTHNVKAVTSMCCYGCY